jgi:hypothetical protein
MLSLVVKGAPKAAQVQAVLHNVAPTTVAAVLPNETVLLAPDSCFADAVRWFCADKEAPYGVGSLLYYSEVKPLPNDVPAGTPA